MNAGTSTAPDFAFAGQNPVQVSAGFAGNLSWANLQVFDYGGTTLVTATAGSQSDEIRIPFDQNNNGIPAEWRAYGYQGHPAQTASDCTSVPCQWQDDDGTPTGTGPPSYGMVGDGLTTWEEYRGFIVGGKHVRTHPGHKDLFVSSVVERSGLSAVNAMQYARENLRVNNATMTEIGVRVHQVWGQDDTSIPEGEFVEYKIVPGADPFHPEQRRINFNGPDQPSLLSQRAVRILEDSLPMGTVGDWRGGCWKPAGPGGGVPYTTREVIVDVSQHGNNHELKRTIAHEVGHAINIMHRGQDPDGCPDGATVGSTTSVMSPYTGSSGNVSSPNAQFNADDVPQIRIRWNP